MANASRDQNNVPTLLGVSSSDGTTPITVYADPVTHRLLVNSTGGGGSSPQIPTGAVNGSNTAFTAATTPTLIFTEQGVAANGFGVTISGLSITMALAPQQFIYYL